MRARLLRLADFMRCNLEISCAWSRKFVSVSSVSWHEQFLTLNFAAGIPFVKIWQEIIYGPAYILIEFGTLVSISRFSLKVKISLERLRLAEVPLANGNSLRGEVAPGRMRIFSLLKSYFSKGVEKKIRRAKESISFRRNFSTSWKNSSN